MSGPQSEKDKKELQVLFKKYGLNLIIECNKTTVDYLDITLNLLDGTYKPVTNNHCLINQVKITFRQIHFYLSFDVSSAATLIVKKLL